MILLKKANYTKDNSPIAKKVRAAVLAAQTRNKVRCQMIRAQGRYYAPRGGQHRS